ncbi:MAG: DUF2905 domain-containing protein [Nitrospirales bacterium]
MPELTSLGKVLIGLGVLLAVIGTFLAFLPRLPGLGEGLGWFGRLPGDIFIKREKFTFYFPLATGLLISVVLTLLLYFFARR